MIGTRPEAIKMAPVVKALEAQGIAAPILATAQHRHLLDQMLGAFGLQPAWDLDVMKPDQGLADLTGILVPALDRVLGEAKPDLVLAQGDTTTVFCAALAAFYRHIPFAHVEAGLRSGDLAAPFPEEGMRRLAGTLAQLHFTPTEGACGALLREGVPPESIHRVGNTVIDALLEMARRPDLPWPEGIATPRGGERLVLLTAHRRENFGAPFDRIFRTLAAFAGRHPEARFIYPVHPNPNVSGPARDLLGGLPNVCLSDPFDYPEMVAVLRACHLVVTDSGGLQEEAPALGRPVLVLRELTERPEAVEAGGVELVGSDPARIEAALERLWEDSGHYRRMAQPRFPYGDGTSARQIARVVSTFLDGRG